MIIWKENNEMHKLGNTIIITKLEVAIETLKKGKAAGIDNMFSKYIKHKPQNYGC